MQTTFLQWLQCLIGMHLHSTFSFWWSHINGGSRGPTCGCFTWKLNRKRWKYYNCNYITHDLDIKCHFIYCKYCSGSSAGVSSCLLHYEGSAGWPQCVRVCVQRRVSFWFVSTAWIYLCFLLYHFMVSLCVKCCFNLITSLIWPWSKRPCTGFLLISGYSSKF